MATALLAASTVQASIVYSGDQHLVINLGDYRQGVTAPLQIDLNDDGVNDVEFFTLQPVPSEPTFVIFDGEVLNGGYHSGPESSTFAELSKGVSIDSSELTIGDPGWTMQWPDSIWWPGTFAGSFYGYGADEFYFSVKFKIGGDFHFAWVGAEVPTSYDSMTIDGWAYETIAGAPILTGDEGLPSSSPVPEPSTYGVFAAAGLVGLACLRRRKRA